MSSSFFLTQPTSLSVENITSAGNLLEGFSSSDFASMPEDTVRDSIDSFAVLDLKVDQARGVLSQVCVKFQIIMPLFWISAIEYSSSQPWEEISELKQLPWGIFSNMLLGLK